MRIFLSALAALTILCVSSVSIFSSQPIAPVHAATVTDLQKQKQLLDQQAQQKAAAAAQEAAKAQQAQDKLDEISGQMQALQGSISDTNTAIANTESQIEQQNQQIAGLESDLRGIVDKEDILVRHLYIEAVTMNDDFTVLANASVSDREREEAQFIALKKSVAILQVRTMEEKMAIEQTRAGLLAKNQDLNNLRDQQSSQQRGLADYQNFQVSIKQNATVAMQQYDAEAKAAQSQEGKLEQQISAALTVAINSHKAVPSGGVAGAVGSRVHRGDVIGHRGSTGFSSGPHVHLEVRKNGTPVDPSPYLANGTIGWPVTNYVISQGFGWTSYAQSGLYGGSIHTGLDLAGPEGDPVYAPADGVVILKQYYGGYGNAWAEQLDNGLVVLCGHMTGY